MNKKFTLYILFFAVILCSCNQVASDTYAANKTDSSSQTDIRNTVIRSTKDTSQMQAVPDFNVASTFVNKYIQAIAGPHGGPASWVQQSSLLTENFKNQYRRFSKTEESLRSDNIKSGFNRRLCNPCW